jgi:hypothetical protein
LDLQISKMMNPHALRNQQLTVLSNFLVTSDGKYAAQKGLEKHTFDELYNKVLNIDEVDCDFEL